jgi:hypothetical protein
MEGDHSSLILAQTKSENGGYEQFTALRISREKLCSLNTLPQETVCFTSYTTFDKKWFEPFQQAQRRRSKRFFDGTVLVQENAFF